MGFDPGSAVILSAILATAGWWSAQRAGRKDNRRKHTFDAIKDTRESAALIAAFAAVRAKRLGGLAPANSLENQAEFPHYVKILDHYEYMCSSVWTGDLDEKMLFQSECSRVVAIAQVFGSYISSKRLGGPDDSPQPSMYENITNLAARWSGEKSERTASMILAEWLLMRPYVPGNAKKYWLSIQAAIKQGWAL